MEISTDIRRYVNIRQQRKADALDLLIVITFGLISLGIFLIAASVIYGPDCKQWTVIDEQGTHERLICVDK